MNELDADMWLTQRIAFHANRRPVEMLAYVFAGSSHRAVRRDRFRALILEHRLADVAVGKKDGLPETYRMHFERRYGEPLEVVKEQSCG